RHLAGYAPRHSVELLEGLGHLPMRQDPAQLATVIERWLEPILDEPAQSLASPRSWRSANCA
ncbi:MAG: alpha/beta hydrolase, partial [Prochlorococcaceae cyanobacterium]